jgi:hypothetical protein
VTLGAGPAGALDADIQEQTGEPGLGLSLRLWRVLGAADSQGQESGSGTAMTVHAWSRYRSSPGAAVPGSDTKPNAYPARSKVALFSYKVTIPVP